jgi:N-acetylmuramoyl-L-alanine amidase
MSKVIFLDAGHGAINPNTWQYTTPGKRWQHKGMLLHDKDWFYEGVFNRQVAALMQHKLVMAGVSVVPVFHPWRDTPLGTRASIANTYHRSINEGIFCSIHGNAANTTARGFEVFTSPGNTSSDPIAEDIFKEVKTKLGHKLTMRPQSAIKGGKEANFTVLTATQMPAVLVECAFFDNRQDVELMMSPLFWEEMADALCGVLVEWVKK